MRNHEKAFGDIKQYYNDITANNMALINALKATDATLTNLVLFIIMSWPINGKFVAHETTYRFLTHAI